MCILISYQSRSVVRMSVCRFVRLCVRASVTFLVNVSPPKPLDLENQTLYLNRSHDVEGTFHVILTPRSKVKSCIFL